VSVAARTELRRDEILDAAERVFAENGYHETGIADIAAELGIGHGTFYRYFRNKHDIAATVMERVVARIAAAGLEEDPEASETLEEYREQTGRVLHRMFDLIDDHPMVMRFFHSESLVVDADRLSAALDGYAEFTAQFLRNGMRRGFLRADLDAEVTAQALVGIIFEGTRRALRSAAGGAAVRERWIAAGTALMFDGVAAAADDRARLN
jgi:AcrR family transcriptional regulator